MLIAHWRENRQGVKVPHVMAVVEVIAHSEMNVFFVKTVTKMQGIQSLSNFKSDGL